MTRDERSWAEDLYALLQQRFRVGEMFTLDQAYELIPELVRLRPGAKNVEARIRDALQQLKHRRCLRFLSQKGTYRLTAERAASSGEGNL